jgi:hypothetical protein
MSVDEEYEVNPEKEKTHHQLHILIPIPLYNKAKEILSGHGELTNLVKAFLNNYIIEFEKASNVLEKSPFDKATEKLAQRDSIKKAR